MAEILGLGTTDYPRLRSPDPNMTGPFRGNLNGSHLPEERKDPKNWPAEMQAEWGDDEGLACGQQARAHQIEQFTKLREELDAFNPDFILVLVEGQPGEPQELLRTSVLGTGPGRDPRQDIPGSGRA